MTHKLFLKKFSLVPGASRLPATPAAEYVMSLPGPFGYQHTGGECAHMCACTHI